MELAIGLAFGVGVWLVIDARLSPAADDAKTPSKPWNRIRRKLDEAGWLSISVSRFSGLVAGAAILAGLIALLVTGNLLLAVLGALAGARTPAAVRDSSAARRRREFREAWPDAVDHLASAIRGGCSLPESLAQLAVRGPESLRGPFEEFDRHHQQTGRFFESLDLLKRRLSDPTGDRVIESLRITREVGGGDIGRLLRNLSAFLREDLRTRAELEARQSWTVSGARLAVAAPWLVIAFMSARPDVMAAFTTPTGTAVLVGGAVACVVAYRLMIRLGRLPAETRVLAA